MAKKDERFQVIQKESGGFSGPSRTILLDTATGVQYLFVQGGYAGGLTPLLDREGRPLLWRPQD